MTKITESELLQRVSGLREYLIAEADAGTYTVNGKPATKAQYDQQMGGMKAMGGAQGMLNNLTGEQTAPAPGTGQKGPTVAAAQGKDPSNPLNQTPAPAASQADVRKVDNAIASAGTTGAGGGRGGQGGPTAAQLAQANADANRPAGASGQAKWPTSDAEIKAFQKANGLTPDGLIGGKTMAALQAKGFTPPAGFKPVGNKAAAPAAPAAAAPAAPAATTQTDDDGNTLVTTASGATSVLGPDGKPLPNGGKVQTATAGAPGAQDDATGVDAAVAANAAKPAAGAAAGASGQVAPAAPAAPNPWQGKDPAKAEAWGKLSAADQKWLGGADPTDQFILARAPNKGRPEQRTGAQVQASKDLGSFAGESVEYQNDELNRIVSLVHYR